MFSASTFQGNQLAVERALDLEKVFNVQLPVSIEARVNREPANSLGMDIKSQVDDGRRTVKLSATHCVCLEYDVGYRSSLDCGMCFYRRKPALCTLNDLENPLCKLEDIIALQIERIENQRETLVVTASPTKDERCTRWPVRPARSVRRTVNPRTSKASANKASEKVIRIDLDESFDLGKLLNLVLFNNRTVNVSKHFKTHANQLGRLYELFGENGFIAQEIPDRKIQRGGEKAQPPKQQPPVEQEDEKTPGALSSQQKTEYIMQLLEKREADKQIIARLETETARLKEGRPTCNEIEAEAPIASPNSEPGQPAQPNEQVLVELEPEGVPAAAADINIQPLEAPQQPEETQEDHGSFSNVLSCFGTYLLNLF